MSKNLFKAFWNGTISLADAEFQNLDSPFWTWIHVAINGMMPHTSMDEANQVLQQEEKI